MDNTINSMLENWGAGDQPFDAANLIEDCANDGQVCFSKLNWIFGISGFYRLKMMPF